MPKVVVIVPTYNEAENIGFLTRQIFDLDLPNLEMMVVDDNSPDGTANIVKKLATRYPIKLISRPKKEGLGSAYREAFGFVLSQTDGPDYIIQMDADLSHDPAVIPAMLDRAGECGLVLGSRYIKGGGIENWGLFRRWVSRFGNFYARLVLGLPYRDLTGGFKCWRIEVLEKIDLGSLSSIGYNFQIETTYKAHRLDFIICEVPIVFTERRIGKSKFNLAIILESFLKILMLRIQS